MALAHPSGMSLADLGRVLGRHWKVSASFLLATLGVTLTALWLWPRTYRSESKLFVRMGRDTTMLDPAAMIGRPATGQPLPWVKENEINSVTEILQSRALVERVVDAIGTESILAGTEVSNQASRLASDDPRNVRAASFAPTQFPNDTATVRDRAIIALQNKLVVQPVKKSDVVNVSYVTNSPQLAHKVVSHLVELYMSEHLRLNRTPGAFDFLDSQTKQMRDKMTRAEAELQTLKDETGLASPEVQRDLIVTRAGRLEDDLLTTEAALAAAESDVKQLREKLAGMEATTVTARTEGIPTHAAALMRQELYQLQMLEKDLSTKYKSDHFFVQQIRERADAAQKIFDAEKAYSDQVTTGPNVVYDQASMELVKQEPLLFSLRAKAETQRAQLAEMRQQIKKLTADELRLTQLARELKLHETNYEAYAQHLEQTRIDSALEDGRISNINVIQPATIEAKPVGPKRLITLALGFVVGLIGAIALPLVVELFDQPLRNPHDVEDHLGVALLASIPRFRSDQLYVNGKSS